jgi:hypothetical protein
VCVDDVDELPAILFCFLRADPFLDAFLLLVRHTVCHPGLQYEDLIISEIPVHKEALSLQSKEVQMGRIRRLKRASDLTYKGKRLTDYAPNMVLDPFKVEFYPDVVKIKKRNEEHDLLELHKK